mmetsp:Transcript_29315/g.75271  ORF Transcript_29315/g.75271 Transcript_29315/m.75271 type:complete len:89 (+) Transcript_29315:1671-1937(+)
MHTHTGMVFGGVGEMSEGVRRTIRAVAHSAALCGRLSIKGARCATKADLEAPLRGNLTSLGWLVVHGALLRPGREPVALSWRRFVDSL